MGGGAAGVGDRGGGAGAVSGADGAAGDHTGWLGGGAAAPPERAGAAAPQFPLPASDFPLRRLSPHLAARAYSLRPRAYRLPSSAWALQSLSPPFPRHAYSLQPRRPQLRSRPSSSSWRTRTAFQQRWPLVSRRPRRSFGSWSSATAELSRPIGPSSAGTSPRAASSRREPKFRPAAHTRDIGFRREVSSGDSRWSSSALRTGPAMVAV